MQIKGNIIEQNARSGTGNSSVKKRDLRHVFAQIFFAHAYLPFAEGFGLPSVVPLRQAAAFDIPRMKTGLCI
jgi:hypothetical protein